MALAVCPASSSRSPLRLRLQLAAECDDGIVCRKVILAVPAGLSLVSDLMHYIYRHFRLQPVNPLAISVEGFCLLPAQRLEDVLRDGDSLWVRPSEQRRPRSKKPKALKDAESKPALVAPVGDPVADQVAHAEAKVEAKTLVVDAGIEEALQRAKERVLQQPLQLPEAGLRTPMPSRNQREVRCLCLPRLQITCGGRSPGLLCRERLSAFACGVALL
ncbi:unnamed protein product [Effrenium voratum]|nr:unnamed protein product [Effrenium voratum]